MEKRLPSKYSFFAQVLIIFSVTILFLMLLGAICGEISKPYSTIFQLGSQGLALSTMLQFFAESVLVTALKTFFFSEKFIKKMMTLWRTILLLFCILIVMVCFIITFDWFSINNVYAWISFALSFGGSFLISTILMIVKTRLESKKYEELFEAYKSQHLGGEENE